MSETSDKASMGIFKFQASRFSLFYLVYLFVLVILERHYGGVNVLPYPLLNAAPLIWRLCRTDMSVKRKVAFSIGAVPVVWILALVLSALAAAPFVVIGWLHGH